MRFCDLVLYLEAAPGDRPTKIKGDMVPYALKDVPIRDVFYLLYVKPENRPPEMTSKYKDIIDGQAAFNKSLVIDRKPTQEEKIRLEQARLELYKREPELGEIIKLLHPVYAKYANGMGTSTFSVDTNGNLNINLEYAKQCSFEGLVGVLAHEALHIQLRHLFKLEKGMAESQRKYLNWATDAIINNWLDGMGFKEIGVVTSSGWGAVAFNNVFPLRVIKRQSLSDDVDVANPLDLRKDITGLDKKNLMIVYREFKEALEDLDSWAIIPQKGDVYFDKSVNSYIIVVDVTSTHAIFEKLPSREAAIKAAKEFAGGFSKL